MSVRWSLVFVAVVLVAGTITGVLLATGGDGDPDGLPEVVGTAAPVEYRVLYNVLTPDSQTTEELVVQRPFAARVTVRNVEGEVTAERWSDLGTLVTRSQGAPAASIATAVAPALSDLRLDRFADLLVEADRLVPGPSSEVGGRPCQRFGEASAVATVDEGENPSLGTDTRAATVDRCVDEVGIVLEERWTTPDGQRVLTKRAVELEIGDSVPAVVVPDADPIPAEQGNGAVRKVPDAEEPPFVEVIGRPEPEGFTYVGRYAVVPPRIQQTPNPLPLDSDVALYTDVWRRGADLLVLDQGASTSGKAPFDTGSELEPIELTGLGAATIAVDARLAEIRILRPEGGFVRLAGTIPLDELLELAHRLRTVEGAR